MKTPLEAAALKVSEARKVGFSVDRKTAVGASEIGKCGRNVVADKLGVAVDDPTKANNTGFTTRGDVMEDHWSAPVVKQWIEDNGGKLLYATQAEQVTFEAEGVPLRVTPDGLAVNVARDILAPWGVPDIGESKALVIELKSIDPRYKKEKLPKAPHIPQTRAQMGMIRAATEYQPDWGCVIYTDASDYFDFKLFPVKHDELQFKGLVSRAYKLMNTEDWNQWAPEGKIAGGHECSECPRARLCLGFTPWLPGDDPRAPEPKAIKEVEKLARKQKQLERKTEKAKDVEREHEAKLYAAISNAGSKFIKLPKGGTVLAKVTASQDRYNVEKLKKRIEELGGKHEDCKAATKPGTTIQIEGIM